MYVFCQFLYVPVRGPCLLVSWIPSHFVVAENEASESYNMLTLEIRFSFIPGFTGFVLVVGCVSARSHPKVKTLKSFQDFSEPASFPWQAWWLSKFPVHVVVFEYQK